tara:strand:- start:126 stop:554 length:429 start_codon:yes stop_codon:yes gene_type:complete
MTKAYVIIDELNWKKKIINLNLYINKKLKIITKQNKSKKEFTIFLTNNRTMKKLNFKFRNKKKITDVLSFPLSDKNQKMYLGDIAISYELIKKRSMKSDFKKEFDKIWIHGYLHLLGYNHSSFKEYKIMRNKEKKILNKFDY